MSTHHTLTGLGDLVQEPDGGTRYEFLGHLATIKVAGGDHASMSVVEFRAPRGFGPPLHTHRDEDELFIVQAGALRFFSGDDEIDAAAGAYAFLPHGRPHTFQVLSDEARFVNVTSSAVTTPVFDRMVAALGSPTTADRMPEPGYIDPSRVAAVCAAHGIDIVGPPPSERNQS